MDSTVTNVN